MRTFKKSVAILLAVLMVMSIASIVAFAAEPNSEDDFVFKKTSAGAVINKYIGDRTNVVIPNKLDGEKVVTINDNAFKYTKATSVTMPDTVKEIGKRAFYSSELKRITLSKNLTTIGVSAFDSSSLTSVEIPSKVMLIPKYAFSGSQIKSVKLGSGVTSIDKYAFSCCPKLKTAKLNSGLKSIGNGAFHFCRSLTSIVIPSKVKDIPANAFFECYKLKSVKLPSSIKTIGRDAFYGCKSLASFKIPSKVTAIKSGTFGECKKLKSIKLGKIKTIAESAFCYSGITSIKMPKSVTKISYMAFVNCSSLKTVSISKNLKSFGAKAFDSCKKLKSFKIAKGNKTFKVSKGIVFNKKMNKIVSFPAGRGGSYTVPDSVKTIAIGAFNTAPLKTVTIGKNIKSVVKNGKYGSSYKYFDECKKLKAFKVKPSNKYYSAKNGILFNKSGTKIVAYPPGKSKKYTIPKNITEIGPSAFLKPLMKTITVPASVKKIGDLGLGWTATIYCKKGSAAEKYAKKYYMSYKTK